MARLRLIPLFILLLLLSFVIFTGGTLPYFLFYMLLLTYLLPLIHCIINFIGLKGSINIPSNSLFAGENIDIEYHIHNKSFLPISHLEIQSDISKDLTGIDAPKTTLSLGKKQSHSKTETISLQRRGYYEVGEVSVVVRDVFGLYKLRKKISSKTSLLVYPKIITLSTFKISTSQQQGELLLQNSTFEDKSRVSTFREYKEGDHIKYIHWKLTAKRDSPIIKEFENRGDSHALIYIDNNRKLFLSDINRHLEDKAVDAALSIINYCLNNNVNVSLETQNLDKYLIVEGQQKSDLKSFLEGLARFQGNGALDFKSAFIPRIENYPRGTSVIIITPNLDKSMGAQAIYLKMRNLNPLLIVVTDMKSKLGYVDQMIEGRLKEEGIFLYNLDYKTSIVNALEVYHG